MISDWDGARHQGFLWKEYLPHHPPMLRPLGATLMREPLIGTSQHQMHQLGAKNTPQT